VDIILAGSPCQGFSRLNLYPNSPRAQANNSLIASFASFVDYYKPRFLLLENVPTLIGYGGILVILVTFSIIEFDRKFTPHQIQKGQAIFPRLIACLLEMKYQIRFGLVCAAHVGGAQERIRVFMWGAGNYYVDVVVLCILLSFISTLIQCPYPPSSRRAATTVATSITQVPRETFS